jgi:hypothetical protein
MSGALPPFLLVHVSSLPTYKFFFQLFRLWTFQWLMFGSSSTKHGGHLPPPANSVTIHIRINALSISTLHISDAVRTIHATFLQHAVSLPYTHTQWIYLLRRLNSKNTHRTRWQFSIFQAVTAVLMNINLRYNAVYIGYHLAIHTELQRIRIGYSKCSVCLAWGKDGTYKLFIRISDVRWLQ